MNYQKLFDYLHEEFGVIAIGTEMQEIIEICLEIEKEDKQ